jgi:choline-sulfatase
MKKSPNILFIMVDELAPQVLSTYGHQVVQAPNITKLAQSGVVFDAAYTNSPLCAPARAAMLTGRLAPEIQAWDNGAELSSELPTIAHYLRAQGYDTALSGKMHFIGPDQLHGFQERLTTDIYPADFSWTANWSRPPTDPNPAGVSMRPVLEAGPCLKNLQIDYDEEVQFEAKKWLWNRARNHKENKPFFLTVSYTHPHPPFVAQQEYWDRYRAEDIDLPHVGTLPPEQLDPASLGIYYNHRRDKMPISRQNIIDARRAYYAMVTWVDHQIGELLATLKACGLDDNTIIVFTSDHGEMLGERGMWFKMSMYEWSVRVPLIISWPEKYSHHRVSKNVSLIDLLPTLVDIGRQSEKLAMDPIEKLSGHSLLGLLSGQDDSKWPDIAISDFTAGGVPGPLRMVKKGHWKLICVGDHPPQLFDLKTDPDERIDRSNDPEASGILNQLLIIACDGYDSTLIDQQVRTSQRRRLLIKDVDSISGAPELWNWTVQPDDDKRFVRSGGLQHGEHATKAKARFPFIPESH